MDFAPHVSTTFEDDDDALQLRLLDDLHWIRRRIQARTTRRQTISLGIIFGIVQRVVVVDRCSPRLERNPRFRRSATALTTAARSFTTTDLAIAPTTTTATARTFTARRRRRCA